MAIKGYRFGDSITELTLSLLLIAIAVSSIVVASRPLLEKFQRREALVIAAGAAADVAEHLAYYGHLEGLHFRQNTPYFSIVGEDGVFNAFYRDESTPSMRFQFIPKTIDSIPRRVAIRCSADIPYMLPQICMHPL